MRIDITDKKKCCGCGACAVACPQACIRLVPDEEGFDYPVIDEGNCTDCGRCLQVCGMQNDPRLHEVKQTFAAWHKDPVIRAESTSGGIFSAVANVFFDANGLVAGASFTDDFKGVEHRLASSWQAAKAFRGSKYVQSATQICFADISKAVEQAQKVLFTGTPCQVASLRRLTDDHDNLTTCDIVCHGVSSPKIFTRYIEEEELRKGKNVIEYLFREKHSGWHFHKIKIAFEDGSKLIRIPWVDRFSSGYYLNMFLRPACYSCPYANGKRVGDISLGDCWGVDSAQPEYDDNKGTSLLLVNSDKGCELVHSILRKGIIIAGTYNLKKACSSNEPLRRPARLPETRKSFFALFCRTNNFSTASNMYATQVFLLKHIIRRVMKRVLWPFMRITHKRRIRT